MYNDQKANGALIRENQNANNKVQQKHKNITGLKLRFTVTEKRKLREVVRKRGKVPLYPYSTPKIQNCEIVDWLNGVLL